MYYTIDIIIIYFILYCIYIILYIYSYYYYILYRCTDPLGLKHSRMQGRKTWSFWLRVFQTILLMDKHLTH